MVADKPTDPAVIQASLVDVRNVATDKEVRLELRVPAELAPLVFQAFGWPTKVAPVAVAIARLEADAKPAPEPAPEDRKDRQAFLDLRRSAQAALRCREPDFWAFLEDRSDLRFVVEDAALAAHAVRLLCEVESRADFDKDAAAGRKWDALEGEYYAYRHGRR